MNAMVDAKHIDNVNAQWGPRPESAEGLATLWLALITRLRSIDPLLAKWTYWEEDRGFPASCIFIRPSRNPQGSEDMDDAWRLFFADVQPFNQIPYPIDHPYR